MATVRAGVTTSAKTAAEALTENNAAMQTIIELLKNRNISPKDIQTSGFSIYPEYAQRNQNFRNESGRPPTVVAYRVSNNVSVRVRNLTRLGRDPRIHWCEREVTRSPESHLGSPISAQIENEARRKAVDDARRRAILYADATGVKVGRVVSISEQPLQTPVARCINHGWP